MKLRYLTFRILALFVVVFAGASPIHAETAQHNTSALYTFAGAVVPGAWSDLVTNDAGTTMTIHTAGLPQHAFTVWWIVFNHPEFCTHGVPGMSRCGQFDSAFFGGDPAIQSSILYAAGHVVGADGQGNFGAHLAVGDTGGALFGPGLVEPRGAEIQLVIRSHGPAIPGLVNEQIGTFGGGCINALPGTGTPGPNFCTELQIAVHQQ